MNFSISELVVILLVALLVVRPEQLPEVAHTLGGFVGRIRRLFAKVKSEMNGALDAIDPEQKRDSR